MTNFIKELEVGEVHFRDRWQFELKSEFIPEPGKHKNEYIQEFYLFIPNSLQINRETYPKKQFYRDQTNLIRYKTPEFELRQLLDPNEPLSPLTRLMDYRDVEPAKENMLFVRNELKLLGNVFRSSLRERIHTLFNHIEEVRSNDETKIIKEELQHLCKEVQEFRTRYLEMQSEFLKSWSSIDMQSHFLYLDEFMSNTVEYYFTGLLENLKGLTIEQDEEIFQGMLDLLTKEKLYRSKVLNEPKINTERQQDNEYILYRKGLLNKFVLDALLLRTIRLSVMKRFGHVVGSFAAGVAMLIFFVLFVYGGQVFIINSLPFILATVFLYIIKDRLKEALKTLSYEQFSKWFSDYKTEILSPEENNPIGKMYETVSFISTRRLPEKIVKIRNREFHAVLESMKRPEQVLYYKKRIKIFHPEEKDQTRRNALNIIFRFNIRKFLEKADNPTHSYVTIDPNTKENVTITLPKVYHLNIILKNTLIKEGSEHQTEYKKFRLILDKNGITRVEQVRFPARAI